MVIILFFSFSLYFRRSWKSAHMILLSAPSIEKQQDSGSYVEKPRKWYRSKWKNLVHWSHNTHWTPTPQPFTHSPWLMDFCFCLRAGGSCSQRCGGNSIHSQQLCNLIPSHNTASYSTLYLYICLCFFFPNTVYLPLCSERLSVGMFCMGISCMMPLLSQIPNILALY